MSGLPTSGLPKEPTTEARWLESGVATLFGAIVGLLLVLALAALILILSLKQIGNMLGDGKIQPTIRVEMTNPHFPIYVVQSEGLPASGPAEQVATIDRQTRVLAQLRQLWLVVRFCESIWWQIRVAGWV